MLAGLSVLVLVAVTGVAASGGSAAPLGHEPAPLPKHGDKRVCGEGGDSAACMAEVVTKPDSASPLATTSYLYGYGPADLASAYKWPFAPSADWVWNGQTVAIVDAYDNPNAEADLARTARQFGLPPCTTANGCFRKVNQAGGTTAPARERRAGARRSTSTSRWSPRSARSARSCSSRRTRAASPTSARR